MIAMNNKLWLWRLLVGSLVAGALGISGWILLEVRDLPVNFATASELEKCVGIYDHKFEVVWKSIAGKVDEDDFDTEISKVYRQLECIDAKLQNIIMLLIGKRVDEYEPTIDESIVP